MKDDMLTSIFEKRESFMELIKDKFPDTYNSWPLDIGKKSSQIQLRETALKGVEEMFEALGHLKNWKPHRETDMPEINREEFLEEIVDSYNYFFSLMILIGVDVDEFYDAFNKKDKKIRERILKGY
jgi:hypothetical protein